jgi:hypothetical protein
MSFPSGADLRDAGIGLVAGNNIRWIDSAVAEVVRLRARRLAHPDTFIAEQLREYVNMRIGPPKHHNAWGALTMRLVREHVIFKNGQWWPMRHAPSHSRLTPCYVWVKP